MSSIGKPITGTSSGERGWHREEIKAAIRMRGSSITQLSRQNGYAATTLRDGLRRRWPKAERIIADFLGVPPHTIWPDRYTADGRPRGRQVTP